MNSSLSGRDIREEFDGDEYELLIVANNFQTGFDQPKLVAMYVYKRLAGVATVQTLSRLNRTYPGRDKNWTAVLDFADDPDQVLADFQRYNRGCTLMTGADPQMLIDLQSKLDASGLRDKVLEDPEVALQARNNASLDQFANGKIRKAVPDAILAMRSANESMTSQVMSDDERLKQVTSLITRMVYAWFREDAG